MEKKYTIIIALYVTALFVVGTAFGASNMTNNTTNLTENKDVANANGTSVKEIQVKAGNTTVISVTATAVEPDITEPPITPEETTIEPTVQETTPKPSPGFGTGLVIAGVLIAIYVSERRR